MIKIIKKSKVLVQEKVDNIITTNKIKEIVRNFKIMLFIF